MNRTTRFSLLLTGACALGAVTAAGCSKKEATESAPAAAADSKGTIADTPAADNSAASGARGKTLEGTKQRADAGVAAQDAGKAAPPTTSASAKSAHLVKSPTASGKAAVKPPAAPSAPKPVATATPKTPPKAPPKAEKYDGPSPCRATSFKFSQVRASCEKGGVPKAKAVMKYWVKQGKSKGQSFKCSSCHDNQKTYTNKSNAVADLRKLLQAIK